MKKHLTVLTRFLFFVGSASLLLSCQPKTEPQTKTSAENKTSALSSINFIV